MEIEPICWNDRCISTVRDNVLKWQSQPRVRYEYEYEYDDEIVYSEVEKSLFEKKIEKKEGKAYNKQGASKRPNVEV